jgi:hypothetical protein
MGTTTDGRLDWSAADQPLHMPAGRGQPRSPSQTHGSGRFWHGWSQNKERWDGVHQYDDPSLAMVPFIILPD